MLEPHVSPVERLLFRSDLACVGVCRCSAVDPQFADAVRPGCSVVAFYESALWIRIEGRTAFVADPTVVTFHNAGQVFRRQRIWQQGDLCDWFAIAPDVMTGVIAEYDPAGREREDLFSAACRPVSARVFMRQRALVRRLRSSVARDGLAVEELVLELCEQVIADTHSAYSPHQGAPLGDTPARRAIVEHVRSLLAARFRESHTLTSLARSAGCSAFHLCRIFRSLSGTTLRRYLLELRLRHAFDRLDDGTRDLSALALDLGFSSHSHFAAAFRTTFGVPPSAIGGRHGRRRPG